MSDRCIGVVAGVIVDPGTGRRLSDERIALLRESLREVLRQTHRVVLAAGGDEHEARAALGPALALLTELDRLSGSVGDSLANTSESDYT